MQLAAFAYCGSYSLNVFQYLGAMEWIDFMTE